MLKNIALRVFPPLKRLYEDRNRLLEECNRLRGTLRTAQEPKFLAQMARQRVDLVLDVGANTGQFARSLRAHGYAGKIISIEPLSAAFAVLQRKCAQDRDWDCHNLAIGDVEGSATINVSANSYSSSLLPVRARTLEIESRIAYVAQETVVLRRLDRLLPELTTVQRIFLKIDTQGFERNVIEGAASIFDRIVMVQMELAWTPSYEGQAEMKDMVNTMRELGFEPASVASAWTDPATGLMPEIDVTFIRPLAKTRTP